MLEKVSLNGGTQIYINKIHRFGTDAMLLSHFCNVKRLERLCDFGSGCGIIPFRWLDAGAKGEVTAIELQKEAVQLIKKTLSENMFSNFTILNIDIKEYKADKPYDVVSCNPPYFIGGGISKNLALATARHEITLTLDELAKAAYNGLKDGGRLCICHKPERLADIFCAFRKHSLEPKRLQFVKQKQGGSPWLLLLDARKNGKAGLKLLQDLVVEKEDGSFSADVENIYRSARTLTTKER